MMDAKGHRLIHLFQSEIDSSDAWKGIITSALGLNQKFPARKTAVRQIDVGVAQSFLQANHFHGAGVRPILAYGLFLGESIVQVMTFGKPRYTNSYEWELLRMASSSGINIIGGAAKLLKAFIRDLNPQTVVSVS